MSQGFNEDEFEKRDAQKLLLKSFFVVTFCYTAFVILMTVIGGAVFNEAFVAMADLDQNAFQQKLRDEPEVLFQRSRFLPFIALGSLLCLALGWLVVKLAPFSHMPHAMFLAILVAVTSFIFATGDNTPAPIQTVGMIMVVAGPIAVVIGSRFSVSEFRGNAQDSGDDDPS